MSFWSQIFSWPSDKLQLAIFAIIGWAVLIVIFYYMGQELLKLFRQARRMKTWQWVVLAIDIPQEVIQSPQAVEQLFSHLSGVLIAPNIAEKYWLGKKQKWFSLEIISIGGYIQFLIYTEAEFRDVVESAIYAQYPTAEITEIEDYVRSIPDKYPDENYDIFGAEFKLSGNETYPFRTYPEFEHSVSKDVKFNDPMAAMLENFTRIGAGENFWLQIVIEPINNIWQEAGITLVKEIIAQKEAGKSEGVLSKIAFLPAKLMEMIVTAWNWNFEPDEQEKKKEDVVKGRVSELPPGLKNTVQAVEEKISKVGFRSKIRVLYSAKKEVFNPTKCLQGFIGSLRQFQYIGRNSIAPYRFTKAYYAFHDYRTLLMKQKFIRAFKKRKIKTGTRPYVLNTEELATLWHFPLPAVKAPLVQKTAAKRGEPPMGLAIETEPAFEQPGEEIKPTEPTEQEEEWG